MFSVFGYVLGSIIALTGGSSILYGLKGLKDDQRESVVVFGFAAVVFGLWMIYNSSR